MAHCPRPLVLPDGDTGPLSWRALRERLSSMVARMRRSASWVSVDVVLAGQTRGDELEPWQPRQHLGGHL
jgi:hypothetical protein